MPVFTGSEKSPKRYDDNPGTAASLSLTQYVTMETNQLLNRMIAEITVKIDARKLPGFL